MRDIPVPKIAEEYVTVYRPAPDRYEGPSGHELVKGVWYEDWVPNDHTFIKDGEGRWHIFGITHPLTSMAHVHEGEVQAFHAVAKAAELHACLKAGSFKDEKKVLAPDERPGEELKFYAPSIVEKDDVYYMIYSPNPFRLAVSCDLSGWEPKGVIFDESPGDRDPGILKIDDTYVMVFCHGDTIRARHTTDLKTWSDSQHLLGSSGGAPESPFLVRRGDFFYLFVCLYDSRIGPRNLQNSYQHRTLVYASETLEGFCGADVLTELDAHAPEIIFDGGTYYISSAEWPSRGVNLAPLRWETD